MPLNDELLKRRRLLLGFSQTDLAIIAGVSEITVGRIERKQAPHGGGSTSIDVVMRLCQALQLELHEVVVAPTGNRYERAVRFAHDEQSPRAAPHLHDRSRSVKAQGFRAMTGARTPHDDLLIQRREADEPVVDHGAALDGTLYGMTAAKVSVDDDGEVITERVNPAELKPSDGWNFADTSSE